MLETVKIKRLNKPQRVDNRLTLALIGFAIVWIGVVLWMLSNAARSVTAPKTSAIVSLLQQRNSDGTSSIRKPGGLSPPGEPEKKSSIESIGETKESFSLEQVTNRLKYWHIPTNEVNAGLWRQPETLDRYVLFMTDCGGFNNIRMGFEYFYMTAWLTKRTLVLPPPHGWYLIDFGPFAVMKPEPSDDRVTDYSEFFQLEHMKAAVPVISADEFRRREKQNLPQELINADLKTRAGQKVYEAYVKDADKHPCLAWSPLAHIVYFPSIDAVNKAWSPRGGVPKHVVHHRQPVEYTKEIYESKVIAFPSCAKSSAWKEDNMRFLGQMAKFGAFADDQLARAFKRTLRDHVHFPEVVFEVAARVVHFLGMFGYTALHVRRNELQYKEVFMSAKSTLENIRPLLSKGEPIYIATDETDPHFFDPIASEHPIFKWDDFFTEKGGNVLTNVKIPRKLIGCIEQVICAGGRAFMGTLESTYTSYIFRLRGYIGTPNTEVYFHTLKYSGDKWKDREVTYSKKPEKGQIYQTEHRDIWEDLEFKL